ncbi:hypothetical protein [Xinfangfangia pollutisoli]|uniref:hypothetical protein n=1 Tax=Xinfangfangia pollutisoli TaxID=2865960 RepID=UPI001CD46AC0|nr:hypothetical protein [Xinfangfangia pollutisoli]
MGYNTSKPPFNLAEFLSEKATRRPTKRRFAANGQLGSQTSYAAPAEEEALESHELPSPRVPPKP